MFVRFSSNSAVSSNGTRSKRKYRSYDLFSFKFVDRRYLSLLEVSLRGFEKCGH
jgi:hypothetical protein